MDIGHGLGQVREGYLADLLLVGRPAGRLSILQRQKRLVAIMQNGNFHKLDHDARSRAGKVARQNRRRLTPFSAPFVKRLREMPLRQTVVSSLAMSSWLSRYSRSLFPRPRSPNQLKSLSQLPFNDRKRFSISSGG
jgi:hypothetical protein